MARLGDRRPCGVCGGETTLKLVREHLAALGLVPDDGRLPVIPGVPMWECADCEDRQPLAGEIEE